MHPDIKIQVSCEKKQRTLGSSSTILTNQICWPFFIQIKHRNSELEGKLQQDIKIQVSNEKKQSTLGSTILHPLTEVRDQKICSNGQHAKSVDR